MLISSRRWIFIVEGCITGGFGLIAFFVMSDYPVSAPWLSERERQIVLLANEADRALLPEEAFNRRQILSAFKGWRTYLWGLVFISTYIPVYSVILSLPTVVSGLGYKGTTATLMAYPPYGLGFIIVLLSGYITDRYGRRYVQYIAAIGVTMIALIVLMAVENLVARYVMFFFIMFMCVFPIFPARRGCSPQTLISCRFVPIAVIWSWLSGNLAGSNKRAAATGIIFSFGNIGGAISGQIYRANWAPRYVQGHAVNLGCYVVALAAGTLLWWSYRSDNARRDAAAAKEGAEKDTDNMLGQRLGDLGDRSVAAST